MVKFLCAALFSIAFLTGCEEKIVDESNPELVAVAFFDELYNKKNVKNAAKLCSPQMQRIVLHYKSPEMVARHLFNMRFDKVVIQPDSSGVKVREQFKEEARITIFFEGTYGNSKIKEVKRLHMKQIDGDWVVNKILKDPF